MQYHQNENSLIIKDGATVLAKPMLYADDTCLIFQHRDITETESALNKNLSMLCDWFVDNKLTIHFGEDKTKSTLFGNKHKIKK